MGKRERKLWKGEGQEFDRTQETFIERSAESKKLLLIIAAVHGNCLVPILLFFSADVQSTRGVRESLSGPPVPLHVGYELEEEKENGTLPTIVRVLEAENRNEEDQGDHSEPMPESVPEGKVRRRRK